MYPTWNRFILKRNGNIVSANLVLSKKSSKKWHSKYLCSSLRHCKQSRPTITHYATIQSNIQSQILINIPYTTNYFYCSIYWLPSINYSWITISGFALPESVFHRLFSFRSQITSENEHANGRYSFSSPSHGSTQACSCRNSPFSPHHYSTIGVRVSFVFHTSTAPRYRHQKGTKCAEWLSSMG